MGNKANFLLQLKDKGFNVPELMACRSDYKTESELFDIVSKTCCIITNSSIFGFNN